MNVDDKARFFLARIIGERMQELQQPLDGKSEADQLARAASISVDSAEALLWGELRVLSNRELRNFSESFELSFDILSCLAAPTSKELIQHVLRQVEERELDPACPVCLRLSDQISEPHLGNEIELLLELLDHLRIESAAAESVDEVSGEDELLGVFRSLSPESRARVMALAYGELAEDPAGEKNAELLSWAQLRNSYLSPLAREILDLLSSSEESLGASEIAARLGGGNARSVGQALRSVSRSLKDLMSDGHKLQVHPLLMKRRSGQMRYSLHPEARNIWRQLVMGEEAVQQ